MIAARDALPGRMETVELWPFSQGELVGEPDGFIDAIFTIGRDLRHESHVTRADYAARVVRGGLPEATARDDPRRRQRFFDAYVQALIDRESGNCPRSSTKASFASWCACSPPDPQPSSQRTLSNPRSD